MIEILKCFFKAAQKQYDKNDDKQNIVLFDKDRMKFSLNISTFQNVLAYEESGYNCLILSCMHDNFEFILHIIDMALELESSIKEISTDPNWFGDLIHLIIEYSQFKHLEFIYEKYNDWNFNNVVGTMTSFLFSVHLDRLESAKFIWKICQEKKIDCTKDIDDDSGRNALHLCCCSMGGEESKIKMLTFLLNECDMKKWALDKKDFVYDRTPIEYVYSSKIKEILLE